MLPCAKPIRRVAHAYDLVALARALHMQNMTNGWVRGAAAFKLDSVGHGRLAGLLMHERSGAHPSKWRRKPESRRGGGSVGMLALKQRHQLRRQNERRRMTGRLFGRRRRNAKYVRLYRVGNALDDRFPISEAVRVELVVAARRCHGQLVNGSHNQCVRVCN